MEVGSSYTTSKRRWIVPYNPSKNRIKFVLGFVKAYKTS